MLVLTRYHSQTIARIRERRGGGFMLVTQPLRALSSTAYPTLLKIHRSYWAVRQSLLYHLGASSARSLLALAQAPCLSLYLYRDFLETQNRKATSTYPGSQTLHPQSHTSTCGRCECHRMPAMARPV